MGSNIQNDIHQTQQISNQALNAVSNTCMGSCQATQSNNVIIIDGSTVGAIEFNQRCSTQLQCEINNNLETDVASILEASSKQTSVTANGFPDFNFNGVENSITSSQIITNSITNLINNTCTSTSVLNQNAKYVVVNNSNIAGSVQFTQEGVASANCVMTNRSTLKLKNQAIADASQKTTILGTTGLIIALVVVVIIIVGGIFLISRLKRGNKPPTSPDVTTASTTSTIPEATTASSFAEAGVVPV